MPTFLISLGLFLGGCTRDSEPTTLSASPVPEAATTPTPIAASPVAAPPTGSPAAADHSTSQYSGQVVETGAYHLELVAIPEASGTHIDLFLQTGDTHAPVAGATVTGQIQLPDGSERRIDFEYDAPGEHYKAMLPETMAGEYKVVILTDIQGEKVNARFNFIK
ncbi:hypothetical protein [Trichothermofontia sp.]